VEVARRLRVDAWPVALPGHVVVGVGVPSDHYVLVDPFHGGRPLSVHEAAEQVRKAGLPFSREHLAPTAPGPLLLRILANIRNLAAGTDDPATATWALELSLLVPGHPPALRRELGEMLGRAGDYLGGARELEAYADAMATVEPVAAETARRNARMARSRLN